MTLNYTLSRNQTDATNDRDARRHPAEPGQPRCGLRRRAHRSPSHLQRQLHLRVAVLPRRAAGSARPSSAAGRSPASSTSRPASRCRASSSDSDTFRRGIFADLVGDPMAGERFVNGIPYWFNADAFAPPAAGTFGNSGRAPFRQPGRHQWDLNFSKNFYPTETMRLQFRAELINAFDQRQWARGSERGRAGQHVHDVEHGLQRRRRSVRADHRDARRPGDPVGPEAVLVMTTTADCPTVRTVRIIDDRRSTIASAHRTSHLNSEMPDSGSERADCPAAGAAGGLSLLQRERRDALRRQGAILARSDALVPRRLRHEPAPRRAAR